MDLKKTKKTINILAVATIAFSFLGYVNVMFLLLAALSVVVLVVVNIRYWRCPYCGQMLGRDVKCYCTHCGKELEL